jgi:hypothetical protein
MVNGLLLAQNAQVTRQQLRDVMKMYDPRGNMLRRAQVMYRRDYDVPFINSVWHMDGQHKLINWKFVIHGAVDGKTRLIVFMRASDNNRAETVDDCFLQATEQWGWPSRVRADFGGENLGVRDMMTAVRGEPCSSGLSVSLVLPDFDSVGLCRARPRLIHAGSFYKECSDRKAMATSW